MHCKRPRCGHEYLDHATGGEQCRRGRPGAPCDCAGFLWISPTSPAGGTSYGQAPDRG